MFKRKRKTFFFFIYAIILGGLGLILGSHWYIGYDTQALHTSSLDNVPKEKTALVLGTSKYAVGGGYNLFFKYRMQAVKELFEAGKIKYVIVSGDNGLKEYNETRDMRKSLEEMGIPKENIVEDFAGFRTLDSVIRAKEVFGQDSIIIVSQPFHNERALFIAKHHNIHAIGYDAKAVASSYSLKTYAREYLARVKCLLDVYILQTMPKFYQEKETFPES